MAWRCKECGEEDDFCEIILSGTEWIRYDKNGNPEEYGDLNTEHGDIICNNCGNRGKNIKEIAEWEEDK